jgi:uroporphyrinogen-III synthase
MADLNGTRVALLESHLAEEAATYVRQYGGVPYCVAAIHETRHLDRVPDFLDRLAADRVAVVVFLTDIGATVLLDEASRLGRLDQTVAALTRATVACRSSKSVAVLRRHEVPVHIVAAAPHTSREVLGALTGVGVAARRVAVVGAGTTGAAGAVIPDVSRVLADGLAARGAEVEALALYEWTMPDDLEPLKTLVGDVIRGQVDAIAFTNRIQGRHLLRVAETIGLTAQLIEALNGDAIVAVVGPVCAEALQSAGVVPDIIPARATMESMIGALAEYVELTQGLPD